MALLLHRFAHQEQAAQAMANAVSADLFNSPAAGSGRALLLVSGGRSPLPFFAALSQQDLPWQHIDVSLVDERSVPASHADSNAHLVARHLLQGPATDARLLPLMAEQRPGENEWQWAQRSAIAANAKPAFTHPAALVLGFGNDGHTASLFTDAPQWPEAITTRQRYIAVQPGHAPHARVSLSLHALIAQRSCYVWSNGAAKLAVIEQAQAGKLTSAFAQLVLHPDVMLQIFHSEQ